LKAYLDIVEAVLGKGRWKNNRTGTRALTVANQFFSHDMKDGFPLLTTKKMAVNAMLVELEGFIKGITNKNWYKERKCHIWDDWANPRSIDQDIYYLLNPVCEWPIEPPVEPDRKLMQKLCDDLGPIYGYQWRRFDEAYDEDDDGAVKGIDQFKNVVDTLKTNPDDRRMVVSAWNPRQFSRMALPPCHLMWILTHIQGTLSLHWTQRSCDLMLGVPFNIASYATLLLLLCEESGLTPGNLSGTLCDCHIYEDHVEGAKLQLTREPKALPELEIVHPPNKPFSIYEWQSHQINITNYQHHEKIQFPISV
jgi:thymidylate synthase